MVKKLILGVLLSLFSVQISAQALKISAQVDKQEVSMGEKIVYTVSISGEHAGDVKSLQIPDFSGKFNQAGVFDSFVENVDNGQKNVEIKKVFILFPIKPGVMNLEPSSISYKGKMYQSSPMKIKVTQGTSQGSSKSTASSHTSGSNLFMQSSVNKKEVYVGEEVSYNLALFTRLQLYGAPTFDTPSFQGFWSEDLKKRDKPVREIVDGQAIFAIDIIKKSLFPLNPGTLTVSPARMTFVLNPFEGKRTIQSQAVSVRVLPLPQAGKPAGFMGAVGEFSLKALPMTQKSVMQNTPITLKIILEGHGNLKNIQELSWPEKSEFRIYKSKIEDHITLTDGVRGSRTFEYVIIPKVSGALKIPAFSFSYFSPQSRAYRVCEVPELAITALPSATPMSVQAIPEKQGPTLLRQDISYLKPVEKSRQSWIWVLWLGLALNLGFMSVSLIKWIKDVFFKLSPQALQRKKAVKLALGKLNKLQPESAKVMSELESLCLAFLADKTGTSFKGLTQEEMRDLFQGRSIPHAMIEQMLTLLNKISYAIYAPSQTSVSDKQTLISETKTVIQELGSCL